MKKLIAITSLGATLTSQALAGDREWATVGKVLTGVAVIQVVDRVLNPPTQVVYVQTPPVVYSQPVVVQPQPVVYVQPQPVVYVQPSYYCPPPSIVYYHGYHHRCVNHYYR